MPLEPGATFGRYQLAELLGRGGMGEVYSAYDSVLHRRVALKVLTVRPEGAAEGRTPSSADGPARILREARSAAGITHPNAVSIYDVGEIDGVSFLAMELVSGRTLRAFVGDVAVPLSRRIRWIADVARALGAAHQLGLVHRDIKPENVMVRDDGFVKVLDFGIARRAVTHTHGEPKPPPDPKDLAALTTFAVTNGTLTADGVVMGTPMYMAPEQIRAGAIDGRADQFAWGVLAYEVLTGKTPWEGEGIAIFSQILSREVDPLSQRNAEIPTRVDAVVRKALNKLPDARFKKMEEIADELESFAASGAATTTGGTRISIPVREMENAATEQISAAEQSAAVQSGWPARTQGNGGSLAPRKRASPLVIAAVAVGVAVAGVAGVRGRTGAQVAQQGVVDAGPVDVPSQLSTNPDATAAYRAGMQALRDGSQGAARTQFTHAVQLDPLFAAAQLRLALTKLLAPTAATITSADLQGAHASQTSLGTHDQILLDAFELVARQPPDFAGGRRVFEAAMHSHPTDGDFPFQLGLLLDLASQPVEAESALDAALASDPTLACAWRLKGDVLIELGKDDAAAEALGRCLNVSPGATSCLWDLMTIDVNAGKCQDAVTTARRLIPLTPENPRPYFGLAQGLVGSGEPDDAVRAALSQFLDRVAAPQRPQQAVFAEVALAIRRGDFTGAERRYADFERLHETQEAMVFEANYPRVLLDLELGRSQDAVSIAEGYLRQHSGLTPDADALDRSLVMQATERLAGAFSRESFIAARDRWLAQNQTRDPVRTWIEAYARPAESREDANTALAAMPDTHPLLDVFHMRPYDAEPIGRTLALAGRFDDAIPYLTAATSACNVLNGTDATYSIWAAFDLGHLLEERGDAAGACAAYTRILGHWGAATPRSQSATKALKRKRALGCAP